MGNYFNNLILCDLAYLILQYTNLILAKELNTLLKQELMSYIIMVQ